MKYKDIDIKTARKCCKQHSYKDKKGQIIPKCETCPLERIHKFCWYILKSLYEADKEKLEECPIFKTEYDALMEEDIQKQLDWDNWIASQNTLP